MKIADLILLSLFIRYNEKYNIAHAPTTVLSGTQFSILNVLQSLIPKNQKKCNNTEMKSWRPFTDATQHLTPDVVNISKSRKRYSIIHNFRTKKYVNVEILCV